MLKNKEKILKTLNDFGFSKYEAKAYLALLQKSDISAYEISKISTVPQSKIYETVKKLTAKGLAVAKGSNPVKYSPLPIDEFLKRYKNNVEKSIDFLKDSLHNIGDQAAVDYMWHFEERNEILNKAKKIINDAEEKLSLEIWDDQFKLLLDELEAAEKRGVKIIIIYYGKKIKDIGEMYFHEMEGMKESANKVGQWLTLNKDEEESLFAIFKNLRNQAVWTQNNAFMLLAETMISHDIYIAELYNEFGDKINDKFGPNLKEIRNKL
ncbi:MAG: TrmB family transcriptional regulator [Bacillota bacterium]